MANSVASSVKQIIDMSPFVSELLVLDVISFSNLSKFIQPKVEEKLGKKVKNAAIVMAIRRYTEDLKVEKSAFSQEKLQYEISMKTNIYDVNLVRNNSFMSKLNFLYQKVDLAKGDFLNITIGSHEISLSISDKYKEIVDELVANETVMHKIDDLVALTIQFNGNFLKTPGILYLATRKLAWENINLIEIVSTMNDLTFVLSRQDSMRAFSVLQSFFNNEL
ncbi:MAG: hypothetical protein GX903_01880 [Spirochaetales bacterium]|nr:hypothetical protein [Spirochaetales bacterium]